MRAGTLAPPPQSGCRASQTRSWRALPTCQASWFSTAIAVVMVQQAVKRLTKPVHDFNVEMLRLKTKATTNKFENRLKKPLMHGVTRSLAGMAGVRGTGSKPDQQRGLQSETCKMTSQQ